MRIVSDKPVNYETAAADSPRRHRLMEPQRAFRKAGGFSGIPGRVNGAGAFKSFVFRSIGHELNEQDMQRNSQWPTESRAVVKAPLTTAMRAAPTGVKGLIRKGSEYGGIADFRFGRN